MSTETIDVEVDVLIVGAGVTGLTAAIALADLGVSALTIAKHPGPAPQPRAHITNQRTMEVFRDFGIEGDVLGIGVRLQDMGNTVLATGFTGEELYRFASYGTGARLADYCSASPCVPVNAPQHVLEPVLLAAARNRGADVRFGHELLTIGHQGDGVVARVLDRAQCVEYKVRAAYAIGADGGRSRVAEQLGVEFEGEAALMNMVNAWLEVDLTEHTAFRPAVIYMIAQPGGDSWVGSGSFVCVTPWREWVMLRQYDASQGDPDTSDEAVIGAARALIGDPDIPVRVKGTSTWQVNNLVARQYREGRVFLAGDAVHRHNPSGGLGTNTSVQDAYNLAWKVAFVVKGWAGKGLLDSYDQERRPVGCQIVDRAMRSLKNMGVVVDALGLQAGQTAEQGWAALRELGSDSDVAVRRRAELDDAVALLHYRSNAHGIDIGQRYVSSCAVIDDGTPFPASDRDPELYYEPTTHPGAHLPHAWLEKDRRRMSTLDVVGRGRFGLIVGIGGQPWREAAESVSAELGVSLPVYALGYRCEYDDVLSEWAAIREIDDRGALLVRPDGHVAWRAMTGPEPGSARERLADAFRRVLSLDRSVVLDDSAAIT